MKQSIVLLILFTLSLYAKKKNMMIMSKGKTIQYELSTVDSIFFKYGYGVNITINGPGTVTPSEVTNILEGENQTFSFIPNSGQSIASVVVNGINKGAIATYTFENFSGDSSLVINFEESPLPYRNISGPITSNETWSKDTLYKVIGNTLIETEATITIEAGTKIDFFDNSYIKIKGGFSAVGTETDSITFTNANLDLLWAGPTTFNEDGSYKAGPRFEYCNIENGSISALEIETFNAYGAYIKNTHLSSLSTRYTIIGTYIKNCIIDRIGGSSSDVNFINGKILNSFLPFVYLNGYAASFTMEKCSVNHLIVDRWSSNISMQYNTIDTMNLKRPSTSITYSPSFHNNNILSTCKITNASDDDLHIDATNNYWGETTTAEMNSKGENANIEAIHDYYDDFNLNKIDYKDWKLSPIEGAIPDWEQ